MTSIWALIPDHLLGRLPEAERQQMEEELATSPSLQREVDAMAETLALTAAHAQAPLPPPAALRDRLLATVAGVDRFTPFLDDLTRLFELPVETLRAHLVRIDDRQGAAWDTTLMGVTLDATELFHFPAGPRLAATGAAAGVLRMRAGAPFPRHRHDGDEITYVLEGGCCLDGTIHGPGTAVEALAGTTHAIRAAPERDLVVMVLHRGVTLI